MKPLSSNRLFHRSFLSTCVFANSIAVLLISQSAPAADAYWDATTTAGIQNTSGNWGADSFWSTSAGTTLSAWTVSDSAFFGNGSVGGEYTIAVSGTQTASAVRQVGASTAGNFTLDGGALTLNGATVPIRTDHGTFTINSAITATGGRLDLIAGTTTVLGGVNAFNATITQNGLGTVKLTNASALGGTGTVYAAGVAGGTSILDINGLAISGRSFRALNTFSASLLSSSTSADASWAGNIELGTSTAFSGNVSAGATEAGRSLTLAGNISGGSGGTGILSTLANSRLILTGTSNTSTAGTTVATNSTLTVGNNTLTGSLGTGGVSLTAADSTLAFNRSNALLVPNLITGLGKVTAQNSTGNVTLSGANTYSGGTTVSGGRLTIGIASTATGSTLLTGATGIGNVTLGDGVTLAQSGSLWYAETVTLQGDVTLEGNSRQQVGFKTLDLAGGTRTLFVNPTGGNVKQTITGNTALEGTGRSRWEMLDISDTHPAVANTGTLTVQNGNLALASNLTGSDYAGFMFQFPSIFAGNTGLIVGPNVLLKTGVEGALGTTTDSTLTAKLTVNGIWSLGSSSGSGHTVYSLSGSGKVYASMDSAHSTGRIVTLNGTAGSTDFSGELSDGPGTGKLSITKTGASTQILSGTNTYTGDTTVTAGKLVINGNVSTSTLTSVSGSGTLGGTGTVGAASILAGGTLAPGNSIGTLNFSQTLTLAGISNFEIDPTLGLGFNADLANVSSGVIYGGALNVIYAGSSANFAEGMMFNLFDATSFTGNFATLNLPTLTGGLAWQNDLALNGSITVIPEPNAATLVSGLGVLALLRRRRN